MKRKALPLILCLVLLLCSIPVTAFATLLSPAVEVLAKDATLVKSGYLGQSVAFSASDFKEALGTSELSVVTVTSLPDEKAGVLKLASSRVEKGQSISVAVLDMLKFLPVNDAVTDASFTFTAGTAAGGAEILCEIHLLEKKNEAPSLYSLDNLSVETQKGISYFGTLSASDPEGDALHFRVISYPKYGTLTLIDAALGEYRYTPASSFTGKDSFTFVVRDEYGNYSAPTAVSIRVSRRDSTLVYADMKDNAACLASLILTERGLMLGRLSGDNLYFDPEETVSRGDFAVMAMKAAGVSAIEGLTDTCFDDNADIPDEIRPYIATAQLLGFVNGSFNGEGLYFEAERPITRAEAAVILCNVLGLEASDEAVSAMAKVSEGESIPSWATPAFSALYAEGALFRCEDGLFNAKGSLSRADAAQMLYAVMKK
ncbi:MAG: cadherin-like domain-containing protein [Clostridia bacterium]|nr:cadherin-like domain-containing protein [Clostridia bacterium]